MRRETDRNGPDEPTRILIKNTRGKYVGEEEDETAVNAACLGT